ncbi:calcium uptake protein 3, mitochondrial-like isoform X1 [Varroa jacobsoni]|uniref:calcium uptake protein 3, mitochondrial-like isoform X1 n=1 Tax=Varroa jacobsoni TaxID=62625 RepID=UPI000BF49A83|nr:calcium uptake protein 3, mitochondrial-like isoform X1 [Varroa jacobsoni]
MSQAIQRMPRIRGMIRPLSVLSVSGAIRPLSGGAPVRVEYIDRPFVRRGESWHRRYAWTAAVFSGGCIGMGYIVAKYFANEVKEVQSSEFYDSSTDHEAAEELQLTPREKRFMRFASVEYDGQLYMTPQDFLDSVTDPDPRSRISRRKLSRKDLDKMTDVTPSKKKGSTKLFRELNDTGIISYTEYLFLLSVLTKPHSGFRIAFNMFDTDGNQRVDKNEFLVPYFIIHSNSVMAMLALHFLRGQTSQFMSVDKKKVIRGLWLICAFIALTEKQDRPEHMVLW